MQLDGGLYISHELSTAPGELMKRVRMKLIFSLLAIGVALCAIIANQPSLVSARARVTVEEEETILTRDCAFTNAHSGSPPKPEGETETLAGREKYPTRSLKETLTSIGSKVAKVLRIAGPIYKGVEIFASFLKTRYKTETNENYWEELSETASALAEETVDQVILRQTQDAVKRMSENLELYLDNNSTVGDFSALDLTIAMDNERETIMSLYAGINHPQNIVLQYVDMVTMRLMLWQATVFRYIKEYTIDGKAPSGDSVCSIVYKWNMAYKTDIDEVSEFLLPALEKWNTDYKTQLRVDCKTTYAKPAFAQWRYEAQCKIFNGYHGTFPET
ncbi:uncharacterized protein [Macrobrachium rosenbergii]|uniref:uncharacterized protein n=1 Tax=Macrobrachium rosenbergii TaxID=79674 RepID=UPI0034D5F8D0